MKILVTGGAGYIGGITSAELLAAGHEVVVFDSLYQGHREAVPPDAAFVAGDLRDADAVARLFQEHTGLDGIMHFASFTLVGESMQQPLKYLRDYLVAGANLLEQAVAHGVGRFILSSTANLFDDPEKMPIEPDERIVALYQLSEAPEPDAPTPPSQPEVEAAAEAAEATAGETPAF